MDTVGRQLQAGGAGMHRGVLSPGGSDAGSPGPPPLEKRDEGPEQEGQGMPGPHGAVSRQQLPLSSSLLCALNGASAPHIRGLRPQSHLQPHEPAVPSEVSASSALHPDPHPELRERSRRPWKLV